MCNKVFRGANEAISAPAHFYSRITSSVVGSWKDRVTRRFRGQSFAYRLRDGPPFRGGCRTVDSRRVSSSSRLSEIRTSNLLWLKSLLHKYILLRFFLIKLGQSLSSAKHKGRENSSPILQTYPRSRCLQPVTRGRL